MSADSLDGKKLIGDLIPKKLMIHVGEHVVDASLLAEALESAAQSIREVLPAAVSDTTPSEPHRSTWDGTRWICRHCEKYFQSEPERLEHDDRWVAPPVPARDEWEGAELIAAERRRQITEEGYDAEHDKGHAEQLVAAAMSYASAGRREIQGCSPGRLFIWPWADLYWKPTGDPRRDLTKAGALIAAAIDALPVTEEDR